MSRGLKEHSISPAESRLANLASGKSSNSDHVTSARKYNRDFIRAWEDVFEGALCRINLGF